MYMDLERCQANTRGGGGSECGSGARCGNRDKKCLSRSERPAFREVPIWERAAGDGHPSPSRAIGIIELGGNRKVIHGAQSFAGKILSRRELALQNRYTAGLASAV